MKRRLRILLVEDSEADTLLLSHELQRGGYEIALQRVDTAERMSKALADQTWDLVLSDYTLPLFAGTDALAILKKSGRDLPFIFVSGTIGEEKAVAAMRAGACDYVMKDNLTRLIPAVERELREAETRREQKRAEERLRHLAYHDALTDLPNYALLRERLEQAILPGGPAKPFALMIMELDRFQDINDMLGYELTNRLLREIGPRLKNELLDGDIIACLRSNEFAVFLPTTATPADSARVAQSILTALERPFSLNDVTLEAQAHLGIAIFPEHGSHPDELMQRARTALSAAKRSYNRHAVYSADLNHTTEEITLVAELRRAIAQNELFLLYQPKVDLKSRRVTGVEALVRWNHSRKGLVTPNRFIPLAERTGLIMPLTDWVLREALRQCAKWNQQEVKIDMGVNLSMWNLQAEELPDRIAELLGSYGVPAEQLELEITESAIMANPSRAMERVTRMRQMGLRFSIDDFGTGYSSLSYLKRLPIDEIKIDQSFVRNMAVHEEDAAIVRLIVDLGHDLRLKLVAEGVEDRETVDLLVKLGCDRAQGYYICRPAPAADLTPRLKEPTWELH